MTRMRVGILATVLVLCGCAAPVADTPEARLEQARDVAQLEVDGGALNDALNLGADIAWTASADALAMELGRPVTEQEEAQVRGIFRDALAEFLTPEAWVEASAAVYADQLTAAELDDLARFYRTATGTKLLSIQEQLTTRLGDAAEAIVVANEAAFAARVDEALAEAFPEIGGQ
ncbi:MAG: hypothetical protein AMS20_00985 [Gemmatimonas sp. SG8_28]|nr:MAG: hypothetical protein AMS20_00985 [Gemmatimonas sp. SG8_28]